jgi:transcriptional regulator with XRE-family HTH domain
MTKRYIFSVIGKARKKALYHFLGSGLPNIYLANGFTIETDPEYGELVTIDRLPALFMAIAFRLATMPDRLTGAEFRFIRKRMELSQSELAKLLQINEQTVANYEKGKTDAGAADTAVRYLFLAHVSDDEDIAQELRLEAEELMKPSRRASSVPPRAEPWIFAECG